MISSSSAPARSSGCGGICSSCVPSSSGHSTRRAEPGAVLDLLDRRLRARGLRAGQDPARAESPSLRPQSRDRALHRVLAELVKTHRPQLLAEMGCGASTAAILIGHTAGNERFGSDASFALQTGTVPSRAPRGSAPSTASTAAGTASSTTRCTSSRSPAPNATQPPRNTSRARKPKARPRKGRCAASSATSRAAFTTCSPHHPPTSTTTAVPAPELPDRPRVRRPQREVQQSM